MLVGEFVAVNATEAVVVFKNAPAVGDVIVTTGAGIGAVTVNVVDAEPVLAAWSVATTVIVWLPTDRPLYACGLVHAAAAAASSLQVVVVVVASVTVNTALVEVLVEDEPFAGAEMFTTGLIESTVKVTEALPEPEALVAVTTTVWLP
jgi:hypothetical protein